MLSYKSGGIRALNIQVKISPPAPRTTRHPTHTAHIESRHRLLSLSLRLLQLSSQFSCEMFLPPGEWLTLVVMETRMPS